MEATESNIKTPRQKFLKMDRPLVPIEEYAKREKITPNDAKELAKIGIVSIRKFKGKSYIVDVPFAAYSDDNDQPIDTPQIDQKNYSLDTPARPAQKQISQTPNKNIRTKIAELFKNFKIPESLRNTLHKFINDTKKYRHTMPKKPYSDTIEPGSISKLVQEMSSKSPKITPVPNQNHQAEKTSRPPGLKTCEATEKVLELASEKVDNILQMLKAANKQHTKPLLPNDKEKLLLKIIDKPAPKPQKTADNIRQSDSFKHNLPIELVELKQELRDIQKRNAQTFKNLNIQIESISKRLNNPP